MAQRIYRLGPALLCIATAVCAPNAFGQREVSATAASAFRQEKAGDVIGADVKNKEGKDLGEIQDLVFNQGGGITYAVLSYGGFLGMGEKYFAIPWTSFKAREGGEYTLDVAESRLKGAPGFDKSAWPNMADPAWATEVDGYFKTNDGGDRSFGGRASKSRSATVKDPAGKKIGSVEELIIDVNEGRATLIVIRTADEVEPKDRLVALPWDATTAVPSEDVFTLKVASATLAGAPNFAKGSWPALDREYTTQVRSHFARDAAFATASSSPWRSVSKIVGSKVVNDKAEKLGSIEDLVFNKDGKISYVVLSFGGFLGMGDKYFAIPWSQLRRGADESFVLNRDKAGLKDAPGFDKSNWPDMADASWSNDVDRYYGATNTADKSWGGKASELRTADLKNASGAKIGTVEDIVVDPNNGRAVLVVVRTEKSVEPKNRCVAVPWNAMTGMPMDRAFVLNSSESTLAGAPSFNESERPVMDRGFAKPVYRHFGRDFDKEVPAAVLKKTDASSPGVAGCCRVADMVGAKCKSNTNEDLGVLKDVVVSPASGRIVFAVIDSPANDGKYRAVPWELCTFSMSEGCVVACDAALLDGCPSFSENDRLDFNDESRRERIHEHFGVKENRAVGSNR